MTGLTKRPANLFYSFLIKAFGLYFFWYLLYEMWLHPQGRIDEAIIDQLVNANNFILSLFGYTLIPEAAGSHDIRVVGIDGTHGLWIGDPCNGITLFALFTGFVIAFPGAIKTKLWFIPVGILSIHLINVIRIVALCIVLKYFPDSLEFNHTYTFTIVVYGYVFLLWILWATKFSGINFSENKQEEIPTT